MTTPHALLAAAVGAGILTAMLHGLVHLSAWLEREMDYRP